MCRIASLTKVNKLLPRRMDTRGRIARDERMGVKWTISGGFCIWAPGIGISCRGDNLTYERLIPNGKFWNALIWNFLFFELFAFAIKHDRASEVRLIFATASRQNSDGLIPNNSALCVAIICVSSTNFKVDVIQ